MRLKRRFHSIKPFGGDAPRAPLRHGGLRDIQGGGDCCAGASRGIQGPVDVHALTLSALMHTTQALNDAPDAFSWHVKYPLDGVAVKRLNASHRHTMGAAAMQPDQETPAADKRCLYQTPVGTFDTYEAAVSACERSDMDADACIVIRRPDFVDTCIEHAYGSTQRLSFQVRVF